MMGNMDVDEDTLTFLLTHIFLPPYLPPKREEEFPALEYGMLLFVHDAFKSFVNENCPAHRPSLQPTLDMLMTWAHCKAGNESADIDLHHLEHALEHLKPGGHIALHLAAQNSGLLFYQEDENFVAVEAFEASATCDAVMHAQGRLRRDFPGTTVAIPRKVLSERPFRTELTYQLLKLNNELVLPIVKANLDAESAKYDFENPFLITEGFMPILLAMGEPRNLKVLRKCTRDDVLSDGEGTPWRRSPLWLVLKVSLQRALQHAFPDDNDHIYYKSFILFLLSLLGQTAVEQSQSSDILHIIRSKIARRATKLQGKAPDFAMDVVSDTVKGIGHQLQIIWDDHQKDTSPSLPSPHDCAVSKSDTELKLGDPCTAYLNNVLEDKLDAKEPDTGLRDFDQGSMNRKADDFASFFNESDTSPPLFKLTDFEDLIHEILPRLTEEQHSIYEYIKLSEQLKHYWKLAEQEYQGCAREISNAVLVATEIWVVIDKYCSRDLELLRSYSPEIPPDFLQPLLLPKLEQLHRANLVEQHLRTRYSNAIQKNAGILSDPKSTSFSVRYYDDNPNLQRKKNRVDNSLQIEKEGKRISWKEKRQEIEDLMNKQADEIHTHGEYFSARYAYAKECTKCEMKEKAEKMRIQVLRSPLPNDDVQVKSTVFELHKLESFSLWRDATWMLLHDVGRRKTLEEPHIRTHLDQIPYLERFNKRKYAQRLTFASNSHTPRSTIVVPEDFNDVIKDNPLTFRLYDNESKCWVSDQTHEVSVKPLCTFQLPEGPWRDLQWAVDGSSHTTNQCISKRYRNQLRFAQEDFDAFIHLRAGERIQWFNVLKNLAFESLHLNSETAAALLCQLAWEFGSADPSGNGYREAHSCFSDSQFCSELLCTITRRVDSIKGNWKEHYSMWIFIVLTLRLLSLAPTREIEGHIIIMLLNIRSITRNWCQHLRSLSLETELGRRSEELELLLLRAALLCCSTFDVEKRHRNAILATRDNFEIFIECQLNIAMTKPVDNSSLPAELRAQLILSSRIAYALRSDFDTLVSRYGSGLSDGLKDLLGGVRIGSKWNVIGCSGKAWLVENEMIENQGMRPQKVRYDLFSGGVFINGLQHGSIPVHFRQQPLYQRVFGDKSLRVTVSTMPFMMYKVSKPMRKNEMHIGARDGQIVIRAQRDGQIFEILPNDIFADDFSSHFKNDYVHWLNLKTRRIELRPLHSFWQSSVTNWTLHLCSDGEPFMQLGTNRLLNRSSRAHTFLVSSLGSIETEEYIQVQCSHNNEIEAYLPRYKLRFSLNGSGSILSHELHGQVDPDQTLGTLVGLRTKLILVDWNRQNQGSQRQVLVPFGDVEIDGRSQHAEVFIRNHDEVETIQYTRYRINDVLGRLEDPADLRGALFKNLLHAATSGVLTDPLLGCTGTEESLKNLRKGSMFHDSPPDQNIIELLKQLVALTPRREDCELIGQKVAWNDNLSQLAQHEGFYTAANAIYLFSLRSSMFHERASQSDELSEIRHRHLHLRAEHRNAIFYARDVPDLASSEDQDQDYEARDEQSKEEWSDFVYETAKLIHMWPSNLNVERDLMNRPEIKAKVAGFNTVFCRTRYEELLSIDLSEEWGSLYDLCRGSTQTSCYRLMFLFGMIALGKSREWETKAKLIRTLLAFAFSEDFANLDPPRDHLVYHTVYGWPPDEANLGATIWEACDQKKYKPPKEIQQRSHAKWEREHPEEVQAFEADLKREIETTRSSIMKQWPSSNINLPDTLKLEKINRADLLKKCHLLWDHWHKNAKLAEHLCQVEEALKKLHCDQSVGLGKPPSKAKKHCMGTSLAATATPRLKDLLDIVNYSSISINVRPRYNLTDEGDPDRRPKDDSRLETIIAHFTSSPRRVCQTYGDTLQGSLAALQRGRRIRPLGMNDFDSINFARNESNMKEQLDELLTDIFSALTKGTPQFEILRQAGNWPRMRVQSFLELLSSSTFLTISEGWKHVLLAVGEAVILLQRAKRQKKLAAAGDVERLVMELNNRPRTGWKSYDYPDWVLLEIENDITIREPQAHVALEMMHPTGGLNSVLQSNMGDGKTFVITPMLAVAISNGDTLVRVVVLKPLLKQSQQILRRSLGGFIGRKIYHLPFSRRIRLNERTIEALEQIKEECLQNKGVLVALPEEILSFRLLTRDMVLSSPRFAARLLDIENFLQTHCRDIIDESDEVFDPKSQLQYTVGTPTLMDGNPDRWLVQQALLPYVRTLLEELKTRHQESMEIIQASTAFPTVSFFSQQPLDDLCTLLATDVVEDKIPGIHLNLFSEKVKSAVRQYILLTNPSDNDQCIVKEYCQGVQYNIVLMLRGLIGLGILTHILQAKRWSVDYGLDPWKSQRMAVPYRSKNLPSPNSEFGHIDVAIGFTIISFFQTGLSMTEIQACLQSSHAVDEYSNWLEASGASQRLLERCPTLESINFDDEECRTLLYEDLRYSEEVINFYLRIVIFPKESDHFTKKLCASGWDIVSTRADHPTTGFSGTNDNQFLLPFTINQNDLPQMKHTNAAVLEKLVRPENQSCIRLQNSAGKTPGNLDLLKLLSNQSPPIRAIIDVGAQILEMSNEEVAQQWLKCVDDAEAALFYDENDAPIILDRQNTKEPLELSSFQDCLGQCLLYFDEAHTRGIDLSIPHKVRAAVTLGPRLTKDRLVQACMRMRRLGTDHSVAFFAPPQVDRNIRQIVHKTPADTISSDDVIIWAGMNTCDSLERARPLRLLQGLQYLKRQRASNAFQLFCEKRPGQPLHAGRSERFWREMQEEDLQGLEELYAPDQDHTALFEKLIDRNASHPVMKSLVKEFDEIRQSGMAHRNLDEEQEQEQELKHEIQQEQQFQFEHPLGIEALTNGVTGGLEKYVASGVLPEQKGKSFRPVFSQFYRTSAAANLDVYKPECSEIWATNDFMKTVKLLPQNSPQDMYLATADWVLTSCRKSAENQIAEMVIISQFEANELLPHIIKSPNVRLDPYVPKTKPLSISFGDIRMYTHPGHPPAGFPNPASIRDLNIFAGALHLDTYEEYSQLCSYLGIITSEHKAIARNDLHKFVSSGGFVGPKARKQLGWQGECPFERSPILFLKKLLSMRHHGQDISSKIMGMLVDGKRVSRDEFRRKGGRGTNSATPSSKRTRHDSDALPTDQDSEELFVRKRPRLSSLAEDATRMTGGTDGLLRSSRVVEEGSDAGLDGRGDSKAEDMDIDT